MFGFWQSQEVLSWSFSHLMIIGNSWKYNADKNSAEIIKETKFPFGQFRINAQ